MAQCLPDAPSCVVGGVSGNDTILYIAGRATPICSLCTCLQNDLFFTKMLLKKEVCQFVNATKQRSVKVSLVMVNVCDVCYGECV